MLDDHGIFGALHDLGIVYDLRRSKRDVPYAGFRLVGNSPAPDVAVTAFVEEGVLRLTSHDIATPTPELELVRDGARLPVGAAYRAPEDGTAHFAVGVWIGAGALSPVMMSRLLAYLVDATGAIANVGPAPALVPVRDLAAPGAIDVPAALAQHGHRLTPEDDGFRMALALSATSACSIVLREVPGGWLSASATFAPERRLTGDQASTRELQLLQRWATAGRFVIGDDFQLRAQVMTPILDPSAGTVVWTTSQSVVLLQAAARHMHLE